MTTTYYIGGIAVVTLGAIGVSVERYSSADYWSIKLYMQDVFPTAILNAVIPGTTSSITIDDGVTTVTFTGTVSYWESEDGYSSLKLVDCTIS